MIHFDCPACGVSIKVTDAAAGKRGSCPKCRARVLIPLATEAEPELEISEEEPEEKVARKKKKAAQPDTLDWLSFIFSLLGLLCAPFGTAAFIMAIVTYARGKATTYALFGLILGGLETGLWGFLTMALMSVER